MASIPDAERLGLQVLDLGPAQPTGRSVYLQGQLHANESLGLAVLHRLRRRLREHPPRNRVRIVPNANPVGWRRYLYSGHGRSSSEDQNWNRLYPATVLPLEEPWGETYDAELARTLLGLSVDFETVIDVHTPECGVPHLYAPDIERSLLTMWDVPHVLYGAPSAGPFDEVHLRLDRSERKTSVTLELPSLSPATDEIVQYWSDRIECEIHAQADEGAGPRTVPAMHGTMRDLIAPISGVPVLQCVPGERVRAGQPLIEIVGRLGKTVEIRAARDCLALCLRRATVVQQGYWAVRVLEFETI